MRRGSSLESQRTRATAVQPGNNEKGVQRVGFSAACNLHRVTFAPWDPDFLPVNETGW